MKFFDLAESVFFVLVSSLVFVGGCFVGDEIATKAFQNRAIKNGYAEYHPTTGQWQWKPNPEKPAEQETSGK